MDVLILNRAEVEALLDLGALLDALRDGFRALTAGEVTAPGRNELTMPDEAFLLGMPGRLRDGAMTVKVVTVFESHDPSHLATIGLYDPRTGACRAFMDGTYITAIRTSAAAAVATDLLAREDARVAGDHRRRRAGRAPPARRSRSCATSTRSASARSTAEDAQRLAALHPRAHAVDDPEAAVRGADVVALATHAAQPVIEPGWIAPGTHVSSVGYRPPDGELPRDAARGTACSSRRARRSSRRRSAARSSQAATRATPPSSARSCSAARPAARTRDEITVYKAMGHVVEDIVAAELVYAAADGRGTLVTL